MSKIFHVDKKLKKMILRPDQAIKTYQELKLSCQLERQEITNAIRFGEGKIPSTKSWQITKNNFKRLRC